MSASPAAGRAQRLAAARGEFDLVVIGGGATGCGVALDAAARGFTVLLLEAEDFAKGTSSRATKLVHGGVRYLAQGNVSLVREALAERATLLANAPHLAQPLAFVMPAYRLWEAPFYGAGLKMYDALAGSRGIGHTEFLSPARTRELLPNVQPRGLAGGVKYWDGQFDDARLALTLARTAAQRGAVVLNHCPVTGLLREDGRVVGVTARDAAGGGDAFEVRARCVVNATGVWVDDLRNMDRDAGAPAKPGIVAPSQGVHLVVDRDFLPGTHALLVPKTADGRVLFAVPWLGKTILGTTDTPRGRCHRAPAPGGRVGARRRVDDRGARRAPLRRRGRTRARAARRRPLALACRRRAARRPVRGDGALRGARGDGAVGGRRAGTPLAPAVPRRRRGRPSGRRRGRAAGRRTRPRLRRRALRRRLQGPGGALSALALTCFSTSRGSGSAGPQARPPRGGAAKPQRGWSH